MLRALNCCMLDDFYLELSMDAFSVLKLSIDNGCWRDIELINC